MLSVSVRLTKKRIAAILFIAFSAACIIFILLSMIKDKDGSVNYEASDTAGCIGFLKQFGWEVEQTPLEEEEVVIPDPLDEVYTQYNELQKEQELDLSFYAGKTVKHFKFRVINYPGGVENVEANLLIFENRVIGGDVCTVDLNGFMHGFDLTGTGLDFGTAE